MCRLGTFPIRGDDERRVDPEEVKQRQYVCAEWEHKYLSRSRISVLGLGIPGSLGFSNSNTRLAYGEVRNVLLFERTLVYLACILRQSCIPDLAD